MQENEQQDDIITSEENNDEEEQIEVEEQEESGDNEEQEEEQEKQQETPEQKHARLKRQLAQAEKKLGIKKDKEKTVSKDFSLIDIRALADVHDDDVEEIVDYAKFKKMGIAEVKKLPYIQAILKENEEKRKTAAATSVGSGRRGTTQTTPEKILAEARKGNFPTTDEGIKQLAEAEMAAKKASRSKQ